MCCRQAFIFDLLLFELFFYYIEYQVDACAQQVEMSIEKDLCDLGERSCVIVPEPIADGVAKVNANDLVQTASKGLVLGIVSDSYILLKHKKRKTQFIFRSIIARSLKPFYA